MNIILRKVLVYVCLFLVSSTYWKQYLSGMKKLLLSNLQRMMFSKSTIVKSMRVMLCLKYV